MDTFKVTRLLALCSPCAVQHSRYRELTRHVSHAHYSAQPPPSSTPQQCSPPPSPPPRLQTAPIGRCCVPKQPKCRLTCSSWRTGAAAACDAHAHALTLRSNATQVQYLLSHFSFSGAGAGDEQRYMPSHASPDCMSHATRGRLTRAADGRCVLWAGCPAACLRWRSNTRTMPPACVTLQCAPSCRSFSPWL